MFTTYLTEKGGHNFKNEKSKKQLKNFVGVAKSSELSAAELFERVLMNHGRKNWKKRNRKYK